MKRGIAAAAAAAAADDDDDVDVNEFNCEVNSRRKLGGSSKLQLQHATPQRIHVTRHTDGTATSITTAATTASREGAA